ncbi:Rz-like lysis system protein LysB [Pseudomonas sp. RIT-PI-S]|uniref:Rz-like lysis system protein LysB n=1 Tax=Pseudomonas sp. RIT-PI-S TaxID=3035295 RepID=UPI0021D83128|nr:Rz-like lysis system protein LysB [Pseudomonas sp. RIT-PI-S]
MTQLRQGVFGLALLFALGLLLRLNALERSAAEARIQRADEARSRNDAVLNDLRHTLHAEREAQARLREQYDQLTALAAQRKRLIEDLKRENTDLANWAGRPLPDLARRLHQHPALTGAAAYREWLSSRGEMHLERKPAAK